MSTAIITPLSCSNVDIFEVAQNSYSINDIAWALSMQCRFNGFVRKFYSVAEHCVILSHVVPPAYALEALLHDAVEAYIGDVITPIKRRLADFKTFEHSLHNNIMEFFGLRGLDGTSSIVDEFDKRMVRNEWATLGPDIMPPSIAAITPIDGALIYGWPQNLAYQQFLARYHTLCVKGVQYAS